MNDTYPRSQYFRKYYHRLRPAWILLGALWSGIAFYSGVGFVLDISKGIRIEQFWIEALINLLRFCLIFMFWYPAFITYMLVSKDGVAIRGIGHDTFISWDKVESIGPVEIRGAKFPYELILKNPIIVPHRLKNRPTYIDEKQISMSQFIKEKDWKRLEVDIWPLLSRI